MGAKTTTPDPQDATEKKPLAMLEPHLLPDGRKAAVTRPSKGRDLVKARRLIGPKGSDEELAMALLAQVLHIDGGAVTYDQVLDLDLEDFTVLTGAMGKNPTQE